MKKVFLILVSIILIQSCSSPESISEKALHLIGLGTFREQIQGIRSVEEISMFSKYDKVFTDALIKSEIADTYRTKGYLQEEEKRDYFPLSMLFDKVELISKEESSVDLYGYSDYSKLEGLLTEDAIDRIRNANKHIYNEYEEIDNIATYKISNKETPFYTLRYKIDNRYTATVFVVKVPEEGYRVGGVFIE